jgi:hypothetical protein
MAKEYIELEAAKNVIMDYIANQTVSKYPTAELCKASRMGAEGVMYELEIMPTADVVEVVRCKDCIYKTVTKDGEYNPEDIVCEYHMSDGFDSDDYCSFGKRKVDE